MCPQRAAERSRPPAAPDGGSNARIHELRGGDERRTPGRGGRCGLRQSKSQTLGADGLARDRHHRLVGAFGLTRGPGSLHPILLRSLSRRRARHTRHGYRRSRAPGGDLRETRVADAVALGLQRNIDKAVVETLWYLRSRSLGSDIVIRLCEHTPATPHDKERA